MIRYYNNFLLLANNQEIRAMYIDERRLQAPLSEANITLIEIEIEHVLQITNEKIV